jgi:hypothetical protein
MSFSPQVDSVSDLKWMLIDALAKYKEKTGNDLRAYWVATQVKGCRSVDNALDILAKHVEPFKHSGNQNLMKWIDPLVHVLYAFSNALNDWGPNMPRGLTEYELKFDFKRFPPAKVIVTGIGILLVVCVLAIPFVATPF